MKIKLMLAAILTVTQITTTLAHAIWIETSDKGTLGKAHEVKIYYGEYAAQEFEKSDKWYSDVNTFKLWLIAPDGKKTELSYKAADNHYLASFTPDKEGTYTLAISHSAKELGGTTVYQFNASASIKVGKSASENVAAITGSELYLQPLKDAKGKSGLVKAYYKGQPAGDITITVSGPSGWAKEFKTDANGVLQFDLLWKGWYTLEGFYTSADKGTHFEKPYEKIWRCATVRTNLSE
jgi:uncharacterized GH25 family protein